MNLIEEAMREDQEAEQNSKSDESLLMRDIEQFKKLKCKSDIKEFVNDLK